ncbi:SgcJ/EcaC family oxidoreductase [Actinoplanes sp. Pm04-4]|uniref:SgcJ/EcaC family oxidoreductase n=1 Tax=Paractinoplanes pyxinae TaxID=2997416 RepID=A0ABT4AVM1_9ACTN|nr:SgcJ/EcaC family oxidoreductase [Actinoplanes pyxinae]MCY1138281.1 SgcJ/EcaC family oxidoreductase [Actinoplanes pyxinae]
MPATDILRSLLDEWRQAIGDHRPSDVAALFTEDAVFQGLRPYSVGRDGVEAYYAAQPVGMTVAYEVMETRDLGPDAVLGWVGADFSFTDREPIGLNLTVVARNTGEGWRFAHYHVSPRP